VKLKTVQIRMFRNILDSTEVKIEEKVTCLVGKNESGKSAFLHGLWRLNPARATPTFSVPDHYPAWLEKRHRIEGVVQNDLKPITIGLEWERADVEHIEKTFGAGVVKAGKPLQLFKTYDNKLLWDSGCDEKRAVKNFIAGQTIPAADAPAYSALPDFAALQTKLAEDIQTNAAVPEALAAYTKVQTALKTLFGKSETFESAAAQIASSRIPQFFYFADYSKLPYSVKVDRVLKAKDLNESETTARALLKLGGSEDDYLLNPDYERRKRELENVANVLTEDVNKYWTQNPALRVQPDITLQVQQVAGGQNTAMDEMKIRIWDSRHSLSLGGVPDFV